MSRLLPILESVKEEDPLTPHTEYNTPNHLHSQSSFMLPSSSPPDLVPPAPTIELESEDEDVSAKLNSIDQSDISGDENNDINEHSFDVNNIISGPPVYVRKKFYFQGHASTCYSLEQAINIIDFIGMVKDSDHCLPFAICLVGKFLITRLLTYINFYLILLLFFLLENGQFISIAEDNGEFSAGEILNNCLKRIEGYNIILCVTQNYSGCFISDSIQNEKRYSIKKAAENVLEILYYKLTGVKNFFNSNIYYGSSLSSSTSTLPVPNPSGSNSHSKKNMDNNLIKFSEELLLSYDLKNDDEPSSSTSHYSEMSEQKYKELENNIKKQNKAISQKLRKKIGNNSNIKPTSRENYDSNNNNSNIDDDLQFNLSQFSFKLPSKLPNSFYASKNGSSISRKKL